MKNSIADVMNALSQSEMLLTRKLSSRARIFTRLREGWPYAEIAREKGLTDRRIRQIVSDTLKKRIVDAPADHALLQLARLEPALRLAAGAVASGDVGAIRYYLKLLDQLDRYQPGARRAERRRSAHAP